MNDNQSLKGATGRFGHAIKVYDDGYGPLFIHRDSMGISGIVRARTWEDAYSICEDEFFPEADETIEEIAAEYNKTRRHAKIVHTPTGEREAKYPEDYPDGKLAPGLLFVRFDTIETEVDPKVETVWPDNALFQEAFGFRPNGPNATDKLKHGLYAKDLNGDHLEPLTDELIKELEITLQVETESEEVQS